LEQVDFSPAQQTIITAPISGKLFVTGPAGCGKTSAAVARMRYLIDQGIPAESILILSPQRSLAAPYIRSIAGSDMPAGSLPTIVTLGGLAQRTLQLFWPAIAATSGFARPDLPPTYLTLETAQYYMARVARSLFDRGYFEQLVIDRNRLYSQILDNLNKSALVGFPSTEIGARLIDAWVGKPEQTIHYEQAQELANLFRSYCLENNLLDYSLQIEMFHQKLWPSHLVRQFLANQYRHLIYDNIEEDMPVAHDIVREWLPAFESGLLIYDQGAGYRAFLGADPASGFSLQESCNQTLDVDQSFVSPPELQAFKQIFSEILTRSNKNPPGEMIFSAYSYQPSHFFPEMVEWTASETARLVHEENVPPKEIAILTPFLSDSLRHSLFQQLEGLGVSVYTSRPSRSLSAEPAARCLLTLARMAHPLWKLNVTQHEVRNMLIGAIAGVDLVRADLLASILFRPSNQPTPLNSFDPLPSTMRERITFSIGERYMRLRSWLEAYVAAEPLELDIFLARLFGELLSQPGFGFHDGFESAAVTAHLIESVEKFRRVAETTTSAEGVSPGREYLQMVSDGVIAAQYLRPAADEQPNAVLVAPAYSFLISNRPVSYQFWLDIGSLGWWERLYQPLTHPYVLSRHWQPGTPWTDVQDFSANQQTLERLVAGLISRCREQVYQCSTRVNERGSEEKGPLLYGVQTLRRYARELGVSHV